MKEYTYHVVQDGKVISRHTYLCAACKRRDTMRRHGDGDVQVVAPRHMDMLREQGCYNISMSFRGHSVEVMLIAPTHVNVKAVLFDMLQRRWLRDDDPLCEIPDGFVARHFVARC